MSNTKSTRDTKTRIILHDVVIMMCKRQLQCCGQLQYVSEDNQMTTKNIILYRLRARNLALRYYRRRHSRRDPFRILQRMPFLGSRQHQFVISIFYVRPIRSSKPNDPDKKGGT